MQCNTMQNHTIQCNTIQYHAIPCNTMQDHAKPCNTVQYHAILCTTAVRSSYSHPDLLLIHPPTTPLFQITPVLNTGLSLSEPLQLYKGYNALLRQSLGSMCWLHGCLVGSTGHH